jgi:hypothetical protein
MEPRFLYDGSVVTAEPATGVPDAHRLGCTSFVVGHNVHPIQAIHGGRHEVANPPWAGKVVRVVDEVIEVAKDDGGLVSLRNHDPERLIALLRRHGPSVRVNDRYSMLRVASFVVSISKDKGQPLAPCPTDELDDSADPAALIERVRTHGGF